MNINTIQTDPIQTDPVIKDLDQELSIHYEKTINLLNILAKNKNKNLIHLVGRFIDYFQYQYKTRYVRVGKYIEYKINLTDLINKLKLTQIWAISTIANARTEDEINKACSDTVIVDLYYIISQTPSRNLQDIQKSTKKEREDNLQQFLEEEKKRRENMPETNRKKIEKAFLKIKIPEIEQMEAIYVAAVYTYVQAKRQFLIAECNIKNAEKALNVAETHLGEYQKILVEDINNGNLNQGPVKGTQSEWDALFDKTKF